MYTGCSANKLTEFAKPFVLSSGCEKSMQDMEAYIQNQPASRQLLHTSMIVRPDDTTMNAEVQQLVTTNSEHSCSDGMNMTHILQPSVEQHDWHWQRDSAQLSPKLVIDSQVDTLIRENTKLRQQIEELRAESEEKEATLQAMLNEVIRSEDFLEESRKALSAKDAEVSNLQLQCHRLEIEAKRQGERSEEVREQLRTLDVNQSGSPGQGQSLGEIQALRKELAMVSNEAQETQKAADSCFQQLHEWKTAYDDLQRSHSELVRAAEAREAQPPIDEQATQLRMEEKYSDTLKDVQESCDFYKKNSERVARTNKAIVAENMELRKSLHEKMRELDQQRSLITALQT